jgi:hypothetical protein
LAFEFPSEENASLLWILRSPVNAAGDFQMLSLGHSKRLLDAENVRARVVVVTEAIIWRTRYTMLIRGLPRVFYWVNCYIELRGMGQFKKDPMWGECLAKVQKGRYGVYVVTQSLLFGTCCGTSSEEDREVVGELLRNDS